ncbi:MAG: DUF1127 domain-containing protein [Rhodospirillaceae bacterium]|nr:DUF1127 domain-containing protein [Rhodospirillaceae bacterium]
MLHRKKPSPLWGFFWAILTHVTFVPLGNAGAQRKEKDMPAALAHPHRNPHSITELVKELVGSWMHRLADHREFRRRMAVLYSLDDRELSDFGVSRCDRDAIAHGTFRR